MPDWNYHGLCPELLRAVQEQKWHLPTPIQDECLPAILGGGDVCGAAETGSGKTAAFVLPILQLVQEELVNGGAMIIQQKSNGGGRGNTGDQGVRSQGETKSDSTPIRLSTTDRDSMLAVSQPDQLVCQSRSERQWQGVRATVGATNGATVYFEALCEDDGLCRVGWATAAGKYDLGTDVHSWGFGGTGKKSHGRKFITYGRPFGRGDVIGSYLNLQEGSVAFSLNGEMLGEAFNNIPVNKNTIFYPACVLKNAQMSFEFNAMKYNPRNDYVPLGQAKPVFLRGNGGGGGGGGGGTSSSKKNKNNKSNDACRAIIMAPTRELAAQIHTWCNTLSTFITNPRIYSSLVVGGRSNNSNNNSSNNSLNNAHIIVGTGGRLKDLIVKRNIIKTNQVRFFVLDEADQMIRDSESLAIVRDIHKTLLNTALDESARLQVCFFSATLHAKGVRELAKEMTYHPTWVDLKGKDVVPETVHHLIMPVSTHSNAAPWGDHFELDQYTDGVHAKDSISMRRPTSKKGETKNNNNNNQQQLMLAKSQMIKRMKLEAVKNIVDTFNMSSCMIFCRTNVDCNNLEDFFNHLSQKIGGVRGGKHQSGTKRESGKENIYSCVVVAGKRQQRERFDNLEAFKDGDVRFLICTDVAARGIDLKGLAFVINMTLPDEPEQYYHRIGRVGRAGRMGLCISIVACGEGESNNVDNEKVWYHSNCKHKTNCHQTKLVKHKGCCIYYNENLCLRNIELKLQNTILRLGNDNGGLTLPTTMNVKDYGEMARTESGAKTSDHVKSVQPAVNELVEMEMLLQSAWLVSKMKKY